LVFSKPGVPVQFHVAETLNDGAALDHIPPNEDTLFYIFLAAQELK
jgi:hypothetical protein